MKKYRLIKDLPLYGAGTVFTYDLDGLLKDEQGETLYNEHTLSEHPEILKFWFEEVEEPEGLWSPKDGEECWHITSDGCAIKDCYDGLLLDRGRLDVGNYFRTKEEAKKVIEKLEAYEVIRRDAKGFKPDWWDDEQDKWSGIYNHYDEKLESTRSLSYRDVGQIYFASREDVEASFKEHRKEWLTLFNIEEDE